MNAWLRHALSYSADIVAQSGVRRTLSSPSQWHGGVCPKLDRAPTVREVRLSDVRDKSLSGQDASLTRSGGARFTHFAAALRAGNRAMVFATEPQREALLERLKRQRVELDAAIQRGTFISLDVAAPVDGERLFKTVRGLIQAAMKAGRTRFRNTYSVNFLTLAAWGPFGPSMISNSTESPSDKVR